MVVQVDVGYGRGWLAPPAAASLKRIDRQLGHTMQTTELGRTWARQYEHWLKYQRDGYPIALHPNTPSIHQLGYAMDTDEGQRHIGLLNENGWKQTVIRNGKIVEPWHFEYDASRDKHINDRPPAPSIPKEDDTMQSISINGNLYGVDTQFITHYGTVLQAKVTREVTSVADELHDLNKAYGNRADEAWVELLDGLGIPRQVLNGKGEVFNPQSEKFEGNGTWSREREILAALSKLTAK